MVEERAQRRLAAILAADVVGYSRLMEQDEAGTLATLKERRREILTPLVVQHHGRMIGGSCCASASISAMSWWKAATSMAMALTSQPGLRLWRIRAVSSYPRP